MFKKNIDIHNKMVIVMKNSSFWKNTEEIKRTNRKFENNMKCDILIIGGGITGLTTAFYLDNSNKSVILIDSKKIGNGITSSSTGKLTIMQGNIYSKISNVLNYKTAYQYYKSQKCSLKLIDDFIRKYNCDCDYEKSDSYLFVDNISNIVELEKEEEFYKKAKIKYKKVDKLPNEYPINVGLEIANMHVINPLKFINEIKRNIKNVKIYENICALEINKSFGIYKVRTLKGNIFAKKIVVATHYPFFIKPGFIPFKTHIEKSYMLASKVDNYYSFNAINIDNNTTSMRYYKDYLIMANNSHIPSNNDNYVRKFNKSNSKSKGKIEYNWSNHDVMTNDYMPYIGEVENNIYISTGYNKWGLTNGFLAGKIISDLILSKKNQYANLFSLNRKGSVIKSINALNSNLNTSNVYVKMKLFKRHDLKIKNEKNISTYKDGKKEYKVYNKCPHMGCKLIFNEIEKTWDCPCHGSRFDIRGKSICGPSTYSISIEK